MQEVEQSWNLYAGKAESDAQICLNRLLESIIITCLI